MLSSRSSSWQCIALLLQSYLTIAAITNRTIDDTNGDSVTGAKPSYAPSSWQGPSCTGCGVQPPLDNVFMKTYSAFTYDPEKFETMTIEFSFKGTAIYVYFILANKLAPGVTTETRCDFILDGKLTDSFHHIPTSSSDYQFQVPVFVRTGLSNDDHTLLISTPGSGSQIQDMYGHLYTNFDYAQYTFDDTPALPLPPPTTTSTSTSVIVPAGTSTGISSTSPSTSPSTSSSLTTTGSTSPIPNASSLGHGGNTSITAPSNPTSTAGTTDDPQGGGDHVSDTSRAFPVGAAVGAAVGGIALLAILVLLFCYRRRRKGVALFSNKKSSNPGPHFTIDELVPAQESDTSGTTQITAPTLITMEPPSLITDGTSSEGTSTAGRSHHPEMWRVAGDNINKPRLPLGELRPIRRGDEVAQMRNQMDAMARELELLQSQLNTKPTGSVPDDPPPGYTPSPPTG